MLPLPKWSDWCHWIFHSQWKQSVLRLRPCYRSFSLLGVVLPSVAQTWSPSFLRVGTEKGARPRVNQSTVLLWPDIQALEETSLFGAACISQIMTPSYSLKRVLVLLIMFNIVSESTMCNTLSKLNLIYIFLNDLSSSFGQDNNIHAIPSGGWTICSLRKYDTLP